MNTMSKRTVNWSKLKYDQYTYKTWHKLSAYFGNKTFTYIDLLSFGHFRANYDSIVTKINTILTDNPELRLPRSKTNLKVLKHYDLAEFIQKLQSVSLNHSGYAFILTYLALYLYKVPMKAIYLSSLQDYKDGELLGYKLPAWLRIVLDRQVKLAEDVGLLPDEPLFFAFRYNNFHKENMHLRHVNNLSTEVQAIYSLYRTIYGEDIIAFIKGYTKSVGLTRDQIVIYSDDQFDYMRKAELVYTYKHENNNTAPDGWYKLYAVNVRPKHYKRKRLVIDFAYMLSTECGGHLCLMHGLLGVYWVNYNMLSQPIVRPGREKDLGLKNNLHKLGYYDKMYYDEIKTIRKLCRHKIEPRKLRTEEIIDNDNWSEVSRYYD